MSDQAAALVNTSASPSSSENEQQDVGFSSAKPDRPSILAPVDPKIKNPVPDRPTDVTIFNNKLTSSPIFEFNEIDFNRLYPADRCTDGSAVEPVKPVDFADPYLFPTLTRNELIRLKSLWYYGKYIENDKYMLSCLQDQVDLVNEVMEKDCVILGLLDHDYYRRIVTANVPLAILPRREATCAHTILHGGGNVFMVKDMAKDWRFTNSPHVEAGLKFYAGTQLRYKIPSMDAEIAFGSLCVASFSPTDPLSARQQSALIKFADVIVHTIIERTRSLRLNERERLTSILGGLTKRANAATIKAEILKALKEIYPTADCNYQIQSEGLITVRNRPPIPYPEFQDYLWEDNHAIHGWISNHNHAPYIPQETDATIRAIAVKGKAVQHAYLVVETTDMKQIFDEVDTWFIEGCAQLICNTMQEDLLRRTMEAKAKFLRGVSHELRTPIHAILSSCDLLIEENRGLVAAIEPAEDLNVTSLPNYAALSEKAIVMLGNIDSSARELLSVVNNLLDYDQFENKAMIKVMQLHSFNIIEEEVLRETASAYGSDQGVSLICDNRLPAEVEMIMTDFNLMRQCLGQLVRNAMKFTTSGTVILQTVLSEDHQTLQYNVMDTGAGIEREELERIFRPFEKAGVTTLSNSKSSGLGLTVASSIAELLGGSIKLMSSNFGGGSHFQLELKNPTLACPLNAYRKRVLLRCDMPLTYYVPTEVCNKALHLPYVSRKLENMGFVRTGPECASVILVEADGLTDVLQILRSSKSNKQVMFCICKIVTDSKESTDSLEMETYSRRMIRCLTPVRRGTLWQAVEDATKAYRDLFTIPTTKMITVSGIVNGHPTVNGHHPSPIDKPGPKLLQQRPTFSGFPSLRVLIVDDNPTNLSILVMYCKKRKIDYLTAVDGQNAHSQFLSATKENKHVSLVLMDLEMPVKNGVESTHDIRQSEREQKLKPCMIFMVTGQNSDDDKKKSFEAGANGYYVKPLSLKTLDDLIHLHFPKI